MMTNQIGSNLDHCQCVFSRFSNMIRLSCIPTIDEVAGPLILDPQLLKTVGLMSLAFGDVFARTTSSDIGSSVRASSLPRQLASMNRSFDICSFFYHVSSLHVLTPLKRHLVPVNNRRVISMMVSTSSGSQTLRMTPMVLPNTIMGSNTAAIV